MAATNTLHEKLLVCVQLSLCLIHMDELNEVWLTGDR